MQKSYLINWLLKIPMKTHITPPPPGPVDDHLLTTSKNAKRLQGAKVSRFTPLTTQE